MMLSMKRLVQAGFIAGLLAAGNSFAANAAVDTSGPSQLIESSANVMLKGIDQNRAQYRKDPSGLYKLVGDTLLPNFDTPYAAQRVLGVPLAQCLPGAARTFREGVLRITAVHLR